MRRRVTSFWLTHFLLTLNTLGSILYRPPVTETHIWDSPDEGSLTQFR
jgi:hypothetical protein